MNKLFLWFLEEGGERGLVGDLAKARRYAELCNAQCPSEHFDVFEVTDGENPPASHQCQFLGYDLTADYGYSLVWCGLSKTTQSLPPGESAKVHHYFTAQAVVLADLITDVFRPQLNEFGLFQDMKTALMCLQAMVALQSLVPNLYEGGDLGIFKITGVYAVASKTESTDNKKEMGRGRG